MTKKVLISGGGIGGLSAAIALLKKGFDVEVFEQAGEMREFGGGIQISPNGNRALDTLGVFNKLEALSCNADRKEIRLWSSGKTWKLFDLGEEALRKYKYPYLTVFRPDLLRVLADEVRSLKPDAIHLNSRGIQVHQDRSTVTLELEDGRKYSGDVLVGADGVHSKIRSSLFGADEIIFSGMVAWRTLVPMEKLPEKFSQSVAVNWIGPGGHVVHYPVQGGKLMNFVGTTEGNAWDSAPWSKEATREECLEAFKNWNDEIHTIIKKAPNVTKWALCGREFLKTWSSGNATLLGDACHPTLPFLGQGANHSIEDGVVLARCLEKYSNVVEALKRYDAVRRPHSYRMVKGAAENTSRFHNTLLSDEKLADEFISQEWQPDAISDRYDWLFKYDADNVAI